MELWLRAGFLDSHPQCSSFLPGGFTASWPRPQVRSITLDERVWERSVVALFVGLGNACANAAWEENIGAPHDPPPGAPAAAAAALDAANPGCTVLSR